MLGAFQTVMAIKPKSELLAPEEHLLAWLFWIKEKIPGSNLRPPADSFSPAQLGSGKGEPGRGICFTGKVTGVVYDRSGDFEGFTL